jgi:hypothetical protein
MITKIISGGQTDVDRGELDAAIYCQIPHGGWCQKGRKAEYWNAPRKLDHLICEVCLNLRRTNMKKKIDSRKNKLSQLYGRRKPRRSTWPLDSMGSLSNPSISGSDNLDKWTRIMCGICGTSGRKMPDFVGSLVVVAAQRTRL